VAWALPRTLLGELTWLPQNPQLVLRGGGAERAGRRREGRGSEREVTSGEGQGWRGRREEGSWIRATDWLRPALASGKLLLPFLMHSSLP